MTENTSEKAGKIDRWAHLDEAGRKRLGDYAEFFKAIDLIASKYGRDMLNLLLDRDRKVRLTHSEVLRLAAAVTSHPSHFEDLGHIIRSGNTKLIRHLLKTSGAQK